MSRDNSRFTQSLEVVEINYSIEDLFIQGDDPKRLFECNICLGPVSSDVNKVEILQCSDGHYNCLLCWKKQIPGSCSQCRKPIQSIQNLSRNRFMEEEFKEKLVNCPYSLININRVALGLPITSNNNNNNNNTNYNNSNTLCDQIVSIEKLNQHIKECSYQILKCYCGIKVQRKDLTRHHNEDCLLYIVPCEYCKVGQYKFQGMDQHYQVCEKYMVECTNSCGIKVERSKLLYHKDQECNNQLIKCPVSTCGKSLTKQQMIVHSAQHYGSLINSNKELLDKLEKSEQMISELSKRCIILEQRLIHSQGTNSIQTASQPNISLQSNMDKLELQLNQKINQLEQRLSNNSIVNPDSTTISKSQYIELLERLSLLEKKDVDSNDDYSNDWTIQNYSQVSKYYKHKEDLKSKHFIIDGLTFQLRIFPLGYSGHQGQLSIFLLLLTKHKTVNLKFTLILESTIASNEIKKTITLDYKDCEMKGYYNLISSKQITKENGYLTSDKLKLRFNIKILKNNSKDSTASKSKVEPLKSNIVKNQPKTSTTTTTTITTTTPKHYLGDIDGMAQFNYDYYRDDFD